jgi:hypothetical protein
MPDSATDIALNDLLIQAYRSLLQYTVECWPWTDPDDDAIRKAIAVMARDQQNAVSLIADLLDRRGHTVDLGTYPDLSELHFVSLDYLFSKLIADEEQLIAAIERAEPSLKSDPAASDLAFDLVRIERQHLSRLREMASSRKVRGPAGS